MIKLNWCLYCTLQLLDKSRTQTKKYLYIHTVVQIDFVFLYTQAPRNSINEIRGRYFDKKVGSPGPNRKHLHDVKGILKGLIERVCL